MILCRQVNADFFGFALFFCFFVFLFLFFFYSILGERLVFGKCTETHLQFELQGVGTNSGSLTSGAFFNPRDHVFVCCL